MSVKPAHNPEKLMLFMFPIITLSFFAVGAVLYQLLPQITNAVLTLLQK